MSREKPKMVKKIKELPIEILEKIFALRNQVVGMVTIKNTLDQQIEGAFQKIANYAELAEVPGMNSQVNVDFEAKTVEWWELKEK